MPECEVRKHTPIVSEAQRRFFAAEFMRRKKGQKGRVPSITRKELKGHLAESAGKDLPETHHEKGT